MILLMMVDTPEEKRKFVILYENYRYLMLKVAADILHDYQLAEDAVQEAFVRVAKHMENVGQPEETATKRYLITITKHAAIDLYRRRNRLQSREIYMDELPEETGQLTYMAPEEEHGVLDILKNLPPKYRDIFLLKYSAHLENREIARICGLREGTIRQRIARGKRLIEKELENKLEQGEKLQLIRQVLKKLQKGNSVEETADMLEEEPENIRKIYEIAATMAPDYDVEKIYQKL